MTTVTCDEARACNRRPDKTQIHPQKLPRLNEASNAHTFVINQRKYPLLTTDIKCDDREARDKTQIHPQKNASNSRTSVRDQIREKIARDEIGNLEEQIEERMTIMRDCVRSQLDEPDSTAVNELLQRTSPSPLQRSSSLLRNLFNKGYSWVSSSLEDEPHI